MNIVIAQSGGPTAAINATLAGIVERAQTSGAVDKIYGARHGIKGVIGDDLIRLDDLLADPRSLTQLTHTPAAALGSCRHKLPPADAVGEAAAEYEAIWETFQRHEIGVFLCIGGNDSMDTVLKLDAWMQKNGKSGVVVMGAPKTIDNDLCGMDHSPGFASAARYIATTFAELWADCRVYDIPAVTIVEIMGRHVGWLAAASSLAQQQGGAPQLIYLPELAFDEEAFLADVREKLAENPAVLIAVSEGLHYPDGRFIGENPDVAKDQFGHTALSGAARVLEDLVRRKIGCKTRSIELNLMQRCASHLASPVDLTESRLLGATALDRALAGLSGHVSVLNRTSNDPYRVVYSTVHASTIANREQAVPREWINPRGNGVTGEMLTYLAPLVDGGNATRQGLPVHLTLY